MLLSVQDLAVRFHTHDGEVHAVNGVSFDLERGERVGVVGESGCGKSVTSLALMRLLPRPAGRIDAGRVLLDGHDLLSKSEADMRAIRGNSIAMIFQDPMTSLNPVLTIEEQMVETLRAHRQMTSDQARRETVELLGRVGIPHPAERLASYPHQFSGGMRQRVMIAMALSLKPQLLIADEPTTALDVSIQAQVLELMRELTNESGTALMLITHNLGVVANMVQRVNVMYAGTIVEAGTTDEILTRPAHPYTIGLLHSVPRLDAPAGTRRIPIEGAPPDLRRPLTGCPFAPRCAWQIDRCRVETPPLLVVGSATAIEHSGTAHRLACHNPPTPGDAEAGRPLGRDPGAVSRPGPARAKEAGVSPPPSEDALLRVDDLEVHFPSDRGVFSRRADPVRAVDGLSFALRRGETLGLVGESGSGKSTTGRAVLRIVDPTNGRIHLDGVDVTAVKGSELTRVRRRMQMIFQDPYASLNPRSTVADIVREPLAIHRLGSRREQRDRARELLDLVGINPRYGDRYPHEFSGGQRQRVGIARALALDPEVIVADEPISALDVSMQAQILNLMEELQARLGLTYLFISHDLSVVRDVSDRTAVMYLGRIVELAPARALSEEPLHPYTVALLSAVPVPDPVVERRRNRIILAGDVPSAVTPPTGCRFHTRCWLRQQLGRPERCTTEDPALRTLTPHHQVACHFAEELGTPARRQDQMARAVQVGPDSATAVT